MLLLIVLAALLAAALVPARAQTGREPTRACASLASLDLAGVADKPTHIESAVPENGLCQVRGYVEPAVRFVVKLPAHDWDGRYLQLGCGGLCGNIPKEAPQAHGCAPLEAGRMVTGATDMGHEGFAPDFGDDPQLRIDFAHRAQHVTAEVAKALVAAFYGQAPAHAYFSGCSDGGREALMEAERYPQDFDGIAAGAPALNFLIQNSFYHAWNAAANTGPDGQPLLAGPQLQILHKGALAACDAKDGVIADALRCRFDPATLICKAGESGDCLTPAQAEAARKIYDRPRDAQGLALTPGGPLPGSELAWAGVFAPGGPMPGLFSRIIAGGALAHVLLPIGEGIDLDALKYDRATFDKLMRQHALYDATTPDLAAFAKRGGKLILWHGAWDPHISPTNSISFFEGAKAALGETQDTIRFFLLPGLYHCGGGVGFVETDVLSPLIAWVEQGQAPASLIAHDGAATRAVFPYPTLTEPASGQATAPPEPFHVRPWIGEALFRAP